MSLTTGAQIGPYQIQSQVGAGGMGEVYRARDTRLGRDVALKVLPESFVRDVERLRRFEQEARAVAALNHPNIVAIFDTGQNDGCPYLVSELLEGETLRAVLDRGELPARKATDYAVQIAQGLAAAHEKGIVHRDLKPENIFVTKDRRIKVLDFGLAKLAQKSSAASSDGLTMTSSHTAAGVVLGTVSYMAPEQVRGEAVDARTDIFALGAVLYEMLSGKRAFRRETAAETMTAVLKEDTPDISISMPSVSPALDRIVRRCLEKSPEQRFQSARDLSFALSALSGSDSTGAIRTTAGPAGRSRWWIWATASVVCVALLLTGWFAAQRKSPEARAQFAIPVSGEVSHLALSQDGSMLAFVSPDENTGIPMIFVQRIGSPDARMIEGTEGASFPFWSPDAKYLGFFANGKLQKIALAGGPPQVLAKVWSARGGSWGSKDVILYAPDSGSYIWQINVDGSGAKAITKQIFSSTDQSHRWPVFLPDGNHFLFWAGNFKGIKGDPDSGIVSSSLDRHERKFLLEAHSSFSLTADHLFYADDDGHLISAPFDEQHGIVSANTSIVANSVSVQPSTYWTALTASRNDTLVYSTTAGATLSTLTWIDRSGKILGTIGVPSVQCNPSISADGRRVAVDISDNKANNVDIWLEGANGGANSRFTFDPSEDVVGVWSRDDKVLAFRSAGGSNLASGGLMLKPANGLEPSRTIIPIPGADDIIPNSWSPDNQQVMVTYESPTGYYLELVDRSGKNAVPFAKGSGNLSNGMISPDGKWVAYASDESGTWEVYVTTFPGAVGKWQVSRGGGTEPRWRGDSKEIFYLAPGGMMTAVPVSTESTLSTGTPTPLFQFHGRAAISSTDIFSYDVSKDGKRFLVNRYVKPAQLNPLTIVLNAAVE